MGETLASITDVRNAGNLSKKIPDEVLEFYLDLTSFYLRLKIGDTNYDDAVAESLSPATDNEKLKMAEALLTVGMVLPTIGTKVAEDGMLRNVAVGGRGGEMEIVSFSRDLLALAAHYMDLGFLMVPADYFVDDAAKRVWYSITQRVYPGLDERPTQGTMHSYAEVLIQEERGDELYSEDPERPSS